MIAYLIEYEGAVPSPVYVPEDFASTRGTYTCDAWAAKRFATKVNAEAWAAKPIINRESCQPFGAPWHVVEHSFSIKCEHCGGDLGFVARRDSGWCDGCIPF
jgi:hypothetical protein